MQFVNKKPRASATLRGDVQSFDVRGVVRFYQYPGGILVEAEVTGLPANDTGFYGFHIHAGGSCAGENFAATGAHLSSVGSRHPLHAGDLPPLLSCSGRAYLAVMTNRFSMQEILGRTVVVHSQADDFTSQPAGNAGTKIACGVIEPVSFIKK